MEEQFQMIIKLLLSEVPMELSMFINTMKRQRSFSHFNNYHNLPVEFITWDFQETLPSSLPVQRVQLTFIKRMEVYINTGKSSNILQVSKEQQLHRIINTSLLMINLTKSIQIPSSTFINSIKIWVSLRNNPA